MRETVRVVICLSLVFFTSGCQKQVNRGEFHGEWRSYGADLSSTKYSPLDQIDAKNAHLLEVVWTWEAPTEHIDNIAAQSNNPKPLTWLYECTPLMIDGILYVSTPRSEIAAIDGKSGETLWMHDPGSWDTGTASHGALIHRGVSYWEDGDDQRIISGTSDAYLIALDRETGGPVSDFGENGKVDLTQGLRRPVQREHYSVSSPPIIVNDVIVIGSSITDAAPATGRPPGDVRGYDVRTGEQLWVFQSIPQEGEYGNETWEDGSWEINGNTNVWTLMSADPELGYVYLPFSTPSNDWYGGSRPGDNLFAESLVCLNAKTGQRIWHFQMVKHGVWDYDLPCAPNLVDIIVDGKEIKAVAQVSKQGFTYVFDRETGEPVWPIEELEVESSKVPGEKLSATQPFPTKPPPFERQGLTQDDLIDFTPELHQEARSILDTINHGPLFMAPTESPFAYLPGPLGGANWMGAGLDPETGILYVPSITRAQITSLVKPDPSVSDFDFIEKAGSWFYLPNGLPAFKPPYGRVTAIDLNKGDFVWQKPLGNGPVNHPALKDLNLPNLGWAQRGAPLVTKTLLFVGQEARAWHRFAAVIVGGAPIESLAAEVTNVHEPKLHVFNKASGDLIAEVALPANISGTPMTYMIDGRQYITMAVGGVFAAGELVTLALPE